MQIHQKYNENFIIYQDPTQKLVKLNVPFNIVHDIYLISLSFVYVRKRRLQPSIIRVTYQVAVADPGVIELCCDTIVIKLGVCVMQFLSKFQVHYLNI